MFTFKRAVRFEEVDAAGIVFFARYLYMCHDAMEALFDASMVSGYAGLVVGRRIGFPAVHVDCDYTASLRYGDVVRVEVTVIRVGTTAITFGYRLVRDRDDVEAGRAKQTSVMCDLGTMTKIDIPDDVRAVLAPHLTTTRTDAENA